MRRRAGTPGRAAKKPSRKAAKPRRGAKAVGKSPRSTSSTPSIDVLREQLNEALEQQTATSEVLRVISSSAGDLEQVFLSMLENATRICEASFGNLFRFDGEMFRLTANIGAPQAYAEFLMQRGPFLPEPGIPLDRVLKTKKVVHVRDYAAEPFVGPPARLGGARSTIVVPMLKDNSLVGAIVIYRKEVRPFTEKQISLVQHFAAQAVIAIENTRLLNDLRESLQQQMATSEVLQVIASSPIDAQPVFEKIAESAARLCNAQYCYVYRFEGGLIHVGCLYGHTPVVEEVARKAYPMAPGRGSAAARSILSGAVEEIPDVLADGDYAHGEYANMMNYRSIVAVPMLKDGRPIGAIAVPRIQIGHFPKQQIQLLQTFADQAVIAIENVRLFEEVRTRTGELEQSYGLVRQQAAQLEEQSQQLRKMNEQLEQRVSDQVGEIERMGRLRRFLPPQVADLIVSQGAEKQLESHRREITALFCDLRGFTGFSESSDPEDVMALLREYHEAIGRIIYKYNGTLERFAGDGVMVIFNDPVPVPNPALQAVLMALEMREVIGALIDKWQQLGHDLGFGMGISHGYATLGTIGFEGRFDYAAIGTVSNVASRLCDEAKPGQILVSPRVALAVKDEIASEPVGELTLKGIRRPMMAHNVVGAASSN